MNVTDRLIPDGHPNRSGKKLSTLQAVVVHYTANDRPGADDTANARYFGRPFKVKGVQYLEADGVTPFRYGSAHIVADMDSVTRCIPTDEVAWHCGDRQKQKDGSFGYSPVANVLFKGEQNHRTVGVEICNNDVIPNSNQDWMASVGNAKAWIFDFIREKGLKINVEKSLNPGMYTGIVPGEILILRHHDVTNKLCPLPFVEDTGAWREFVEDIARRVV